MIGTEPRRTPTPSGWDRHRERTGRPTDGSRSTLGRAFAPTRSSSPIDCLQIPLWEITLQATATSPRSYRMQAGRCTRWNAYVRAALLLAYENAEGHRLHSCLDGTISRRLAARPPDDAAVASCRSRLTTTIRSPGFGSRSCGDSSSGQRLTRRVASAIMRRMCCHGPIVWSQGSS